MEEERKGAEGREGKMEKKREEKKLKIDPEDPLGDGLGPILR